MFGSLQSPNFPEPYPHDAKLRWNISAPPGFSIQLFFSHFHLEPSYRCEYDYVQVEAVEEVLAVFCGEEQTDTEEVPAQRVISSPGHSLSLLFSSDFSNEERYSGFKAHYSAVDVDECSDHTHLCDHHCHNYIGGYYCSCRHGFLLHTDNRTCTVVCSGGVFRERSGVLSSVDFPSPYPKSSNCSYVIEVDNGFRLKLQFDENFDVEDHPEISCPYDYLQVSTGSGVFGPFCGQVSPGVIQTDSSSATIIFHSDQSGENRGWKLHYTATVVDCGSPAEVTMADVVFGDRDNSTTFGSTVLYVCRDDGVQPSNYSFSCSLSGQWTDGEGRSQPPSCQRACGRPSRSLPAQVKRIVGGRRSDPGLFPWQVLLSVEDLSRVPEGRWFGSGALLSESWVLTAAHVLRSPRRDPGVVAVAPEHVKVFLGLHDVRLKDAAEQRLVQRVLLHPHFSPHTYQHDIALLRLNPEVRFNSEVRPVCLPRFHTQGLPPDPAPSSLGVVAGWGISTLNVTSDLGWPADVLQYVKLPVVPQEECQASYASRSVSYNITDHMFCAGFMEGGHDTCLGDSGGAFVVQDEVSRRWAVSGLVSWGGPEDCGSRRVYGVYTRVSKYVDWIQSHLSAGLQ
ncbi:mannan-binding lectin serine protease 1 [Salarias fasciatus]|uniref:mannan-binding lectin serine protease 1 n=1 Tax=Salarias fasciatus TaxID=181472 RepID=UPI001176CA97|nr:mannan-binding lectin serine protease 1 [Salarias fasciatus]